MSPSRSPLALFVLLAGVIIGSWALITPEGGGPDEPGHLVRAGGVARGQFGDDPSFEVTDHYLLPEVGCWIFQPAVSAACAEPRATSGAMITVATPASAYPVWGHLMPGAASRLPGTDPLWWGRAANTAVAAILVGAALAAVRRRRLAVVGVVVALTPMAWFSMGIVNPSSLAIAGAIALWAGLVHRPDLAWLTAAGWAALALPRRDGLIWASLALIIVLIVSDRRAATWWRSLGRMPQVVVAASTAVTVLWGVTSNSDTSRLVVVAPVAVAVAEVLRTGWERTRRPIDRLGFAVGVGAAGAAVAFALLRRRPGGWDGELAGRVLGETGANLVEAIGRLGWLDTPLPWLVIVGWVVAIGLLAGTSLLDRAGWVGTAAAVLGTTVVTAWVFELLQGGETGTYWQGRYSLPILVGIPIVLGAAHLPPGVERRITPVVLGGVLLLDNVAIVAAARRFGVGIDGSLLPWEWDTYRAPIPPLAAIAAHLTATMALGALLIDRRGHVVAAAIDVTGSPSPIPA